MNKNVPESYSFSHTDLIYIVFVPWKKYLLFCMYFFIPAIQTLYCFSINVFVSLCLSISVCVPLIIHMLSPCLSIYFHLHICLHIYLSIYLFIHLSLCIEWSFVIVVVVVVVLLVNAPLLP